MHGDHVLAIGIEVLTVPATEAINQNKSCLGTPPIDFLDSRPTRLELITNHKMTTGSNMTRTIANGLGTIDNLHKPNDVSSNNNKIDGTTNFDCGQIFETPVNFGSATLRSCKKVGIKVDTNCFNTPSRKFDSNAAETAAGINRRSRRIRHNKVDLTVRVPALFRYAIPT